MKTLHILTIVNIIGAKGFIPSTRSCSYSSVNFLRSISVWEHSRLQLHVQYRERHCITQFMLKLYRYIFVQRQHFVTQFHHSKVLTNEKRGGLTLDSGINRSPVKLFSLWFLYKSMKAPSCKRPKTNQRTLFLSFAINNCYPTSDEKLLAAFELILVDFLPL